MHIGVFEKRMELCDAVCADLEKHFYAYNDKLKQSLRYELLKFAVYLSDSDGMIETEEVLTIRKLLSVNAMVPDMRTLKAREHIPHGYLLDIPVFIKLAVSQDKEKQPSRDVYQCQRAQIFLDTYRLFGLYFLAIHENDPTDKSARAYTTYIDSITGYIEKEGVIIPFEKKKFPIQEIEDLNQNPHEDYQATHSVSQHISEEEEKEKDDSIKVKSTTNPVAGTEFENMSLEEKLNEFHAMVGLKKVKQEVDSLINLIRIQKLRSLHGLRNTETSKHMVFTGNPGTGKTTVARILASIYKDLGVLEKGTFVEVDRAGLVKGYVGQTAIQVKKVVEEAAGGILFIDEAYTLTVNRGNQDYGQEAVDTLLKAMEDMRDNLIVIVAGYPDLMEDFLESNPGLRSRFNKFIDFQDYSVDEQLLILEKMCAKQDYTLSEDVKEYVRGIIKKRMSVPGVKSANARDIRNMLENAIMKQATRLITEQNPTKEMLSSLTIADFDDI